MVDIKKRILQFAGSIENELPFFALKIFGSENFFENKEKVTADHLIDLADMYPEININWILTGRGNMLVAPNEILVKG